MNNRDSKTVLTGILLLTAALIFVLSGCAAGTEKSEGGFFTETVTVEKTRTVERIYDTADIRFEESITVKEDGETLQMTLTDVKTEPMMIDGRSVIIRYEENIPAGTGKGDIPKEKQVPYLDDGKAPSAGTVLVTDAEPKPGAVYHPLTLMEVTDRGEEWVYDLTVAMRYEDYGSYCYELRPGVRLPFDENAPVIDGFREEIMSSLGMDPDRYMLTEAAWKGDPYEASDGKMMRDAVIYGARLLPAYKAVYEARIDLEPVTGYRATATYTYTGVRTDMKKVSIAVLAGILLIAFTVSVILAVASAGKRKNTKKNITEIVFEEE